MPMSCSRGAALRGTAEVEQGIDGTQRFVDTVLDCVSVGGRAGRLAQGVDYPDARNRAAHIRRLAGV